MSHLRLWRRLGAAASLAAGVFWATWAAAQPCDCGPAGGFSGGASAGPFLGNAADIAPRLAFETPPPPAVILERNPCRYTPHDVDPCFDLRCHLYPSSPDPRLYVAADFVPLFRDPARTVPFQTQGAQGPIVLSSETPDQEFQGGLRLVVGGRVNEYYRIESSFTGFQHWSDTDTARDFATNGLGTEGDLFSPFSNFGDPALDLDDDPVGIMGLDFNNLASLTLQSSYDSVESNILFDLPRMRNLESAVMLGARYNKIDEELAFRTASNGGAESTMQIRNAVTNDMLGLQLGYRGRFLIEPRLWLDFEIKGAIYHDDMEHRLAYQQTQGAAVVGAFADQTERERTPFGGDLSLVAHYLVTPAFAVRLGYQAIYFDGLALAAENAIPEGVRVTTRQGGPNTLVFNPLEINHQGRMVYHGPVAGLIYLW